MEVSCSQLISIFWVLVSHWNSRGRSETGWPLLASEAATGQRPSQISEKVTESKYRLIKLLVLYILLYGARREIKDLKQNLTGQAVIAVINRNSFDQEGGLRKTSLTFITRKVDRGKSLHSLLVREGITECWCSSLIQWVLMSPILWLLPPESVWSQDLGLDARP